MIKNIFKCTIIGITLSLIVITTSNAESPKLAVKDGYASLNKYIFFSSATLEKKMIDLNNESLSKYKYIIVLDSSEEDKKNIIEIFENGAGAYINGEYFSFESTKVSGFTVPARIEIKEKDGEIYLPISFFINYLDSKILEDGNLSINKLPQIDLGTLGEFNDLSNFSPNKILNNNEDIQNKNTDSNRNNNEGNSQNENLE